MWKWDFIYDEINKVHWDITFRTECIPLSFFLVNLVSPWLSCFINIFGRNYVIIYNRSILRNFYCFSSCPVFHNEIINITHSSIQIITIILWHSKKQLSIKLMQLCEWNTHVQQAWITSVCFYPNSSPHGSDFSNPCNLFISEYTPKALFACVIH